MADQQWARLTGDPDQLSSKAAKYTSIAAAIQRSTKTLKSIADESENLSEAMSALRDLATKVRDDIDKAQGRYADTGSALSSYSVSLRYAKEQADPAADSLARLHGDYPAKLGAVAVAQREYLAARAALGRAKSDPATTPEELARLTTWESTSRTTLDRLQQGLDNLHDDIATQEGLWTAAYNDKMTAGDTAEQLIHDATTGPRANGLNNTWWDKVSAILDTVGLVLGIATLLFGWVPILGEVLAVLTVIVTVVKLIGDIAAYGFNLGDFVLALVTVLPFGIGKVVGKVGKVIVQRGVKSARSLARSGHPAARAAAPIMRASSTKGFTPMARFLNFAGHPQASRAYEALTKIPPGSVRFDPARAAMNTWSRVAVASYTVDKVGTVTTGAIAVHERLTDDD